MTPLACARCTAGVGQHLVNGEHCCVDCYNEWRQRLLDFAHWTAAPLPEPPQMISEGWLLVLCYGVLGLLALLGYTVYLVWF